MLTQDPSLKNAWKTKVQERTEREARNEWEVHSTASKRVWLTESQRLHPIPGDVLISVNGELIKKPGLIQKPGQPILSAECASSADPATSTAPATTSPPAPAQGEDSDSAPKNPDTQRAYELLEAAGKPPATPKELEGAMETAIMDATQVLSTENICQLAKEGKLDGKRKVKFAGLRWKNIGDKKPIGSQLICESLSEKLESTTELEESDWSKFEEDVIELHEQDGKSERRKIKLHDIGIHHFIQSNLPGDSQTVTYYRPFEPTSWHDVVEGVDTFTVNHIKDYVLSKDQLKEKGLWLIDRDNGFKWWVACDGRNGSVSPFTCERDAVVLEFTRTSEVDTIRLLGGATVATGENYTIILHKGLMPWPLNREWRVLQQEPVLITPFIPSFVRALTDPYELKYKYWEILECLRKVLLVGVFIVFGAGSAVQLAFGLVVCVGFIILYNNMKPYDVWQNDVLQQLAQAMVFVTLLSAVIQRARLVPDPEPFDEGLSDTAMGWILLLLTLLTAIFGFIISCVEVYGEPEMYVRHCCYRLDKLTSKTLHLLNLNARLRARKNRHAEVSKSAEGQMSTHKEQPKMAAKAKGIKKASVKEQTLWTDELGSASSDLVRMPSTFV